MLLAWSMGKLPFGLQGILLLPKVNIARSKWGLMLGEDWARSLISTLTDSVTLRGIPGP